MNFRNLLWTYAPKRDGSCDIKVYVSKDGKKRYVSTGIKLQPVHWDDKKGKVKSSHPLHNRYNAQINRIRLDIERHFLDGKSWGSLFKPQIQNNLADFLEQIIKEAKARTISVSKNTIKSYQSTLTRLRQYESFSGEPAPSLQELSMDFYHSFTSFLSSHCNCNLPGIDSHIKIIKRLMNIGMERHLHDNTIHNQKGFKRHRSKGSNKIYLNDNDISTLEAVDLSHLPHLERELDRWLVAYYFLLRFSDLQALKPDNVHVIGGRSFLRYTSIKTATQATVPIRPQAEKLLKKYGFNFKWGNNQHANHQIKIAASFAGLHEMILQEDTKTPKCALVTMHTARRSSATNMYLSGQFSLKTIADLGGWKDVKSLQTYLRCSNLDSAILAASSGYFD